MLEFNVAITFPAAPLLTVILALVGKSDYCVFFGVVTAYELDVQAAVPDTATHLPALKFRLRCCWEIFTCRLAGEGCPTNQKLYSLSSSMPSRVVIKHGANFVFTCVSG